MRQDANRGSPPGNAPRPSRVAYDPHSDAEGVHRVGSPGFSRREPSQPKGPGTGTRGGDHHPVSGCATGNRRFPHGSLAALRFCAPIPTASLWPRPHGPDTKEDGLPLRYPGPGARPTRIHSKGADAMSAWESYTGQAAPRSLWTIGVGRLDPPRPTNPDGTRAATGRP